MESARNTLPNQPINNVTGGIDWAAADHAICVVDTAGNVVDHAISEHTEPGLRALLDFDRHGVGEVAIRARDSGQGT